MSGFVQFPAQQIPFSKKTKKWRKQCVDWADSKTFFNYSLVRKSVIHKKINYDLVNGKLHMADLQLVLNPTQLKSNFIPDKIQHYPIIFPKLKVLSGEELTRVFDWKVVVTNPNTLSSIEEDKKKALNASIQEWIQNQTTSEEEAQAELQKIIDFFTCSYKDVKEIRANYLLKHYDDLYNFKLLFNSGFTDAEVVGEEIYQCDIVGGEPVIERLNPMKVRVFKSGYSNKIEDADIIIIEDYWSPGKIVDTYYDVLTEKDRKYIEELPNMTGQPATDSMDNIDERFSFVHSSMVGEEFVNDSVFWDPFGGYSGVTNSLLPYDLLGNIRVVRIYWKSRRKIKKVNSFDPETGENIFNFYDENYVIDKTLGETEEIYYINQAWEGTKIGSDIYVNIRPRVVQYNRMSNPSKCHFGIVGSIYNINDSKPLSLVDIMKPYNYSYNVIRHRLNLLLAKSWGNLIRVDLAKIPEKWDMHKFFYYAKTMGIAVEDSFKSGTKGPATGKLAGGLNNNSSGVIPTSDGNQIQQYINLLEYINMEMSNVCGITKQREGQISNRETVGGVERATLQSSYITEWLFAQHDDVKKRALECFIDTAKIALKGRNIKFKHILPDGIEKFIEIDGDEFSESDYGISVENDNNLQQLNQKLDTLAQAALQNQMLSFSSIMKLYNTCSLSEKVKYIENEENRRKEEIQQQQQMQQQIAQEQLQAQKDQMQQELEHKNLLNERDNQTKLLIAQIQTASNQYQEPQEFSEKDKALLEEKIREFNEKLSIDKEKLKLEERKINLTNNGKKDK